MVNWGSSKPFYFIAFDPDDRPNHDVIVSTMYTGNTICARCSGGPTHYEITIPLTLNPAIDNACGQLGLPSDIRADVTSINVSPPHLSSTLTVGLSTNVSRINGPSDSPSLVLSADYMEELIENIITTYDLSQNIDFFEKVLDNLQFLNTMLLQFAIKKHGKKVIDDKYIRIHGKLSCLNPGLNEIMVLYLNFKDDYKQNKK